MRPHHGGGRVVAHARHRLGGQVAGTGIRHRRGSTAPSIAMAPHRVTMIEPSFRARLMPRVRRPAGPAVASVAAVDLASIVALADVEDHRAPRARNRDQNANRLHARTSMAALIEVAPPARSRAPSPGLRPRATRRLRALTPGPSSISRSSIATRRRDPSPLLGRRLDAPISPDLGDRQDFITTGSSPALFGHSYLSMQKCL
jgi:hypothetical protein